MTPSAIETSITDRLTPEALKCWNGFSQEVIDDLVIVAQRTSVAAAADTVERIANTKGNNDEQSDD